MMNEEEFSNWYNDIIEKANLSDKRYPIKGMNVWTPYGWKVMTNIDRHMRNEMERTKHDEVCFPLLIPEDQFAKEAEHIKGFDEQVYWVTHAGKNQLDVRLLLRPTSETAMYPMFSLWVRSHADLPLKIFQIVNTFRYETKQTRSFVRVREIHFFEAHTCHADFEDAERQIKEDVEVMDRLSKKLCLPYLLSKRPNWDKFAGAVYTLGVDIFMPTGKALQIASIHQYKENFSKAYNIKYEDENGNHKDVHQTTYGMSERVLGAVIGVHGDKKGLIMPPSIAPIQIVIIPVLAKGKNEEILKKNRELKEELNNNGFRAFLDERDIRPGSKYFDWEIKGVPIRIELGPRDIENKVAIVVRRDTGKKIEIKREKLIDVLKKIMDDISTELYKKAEAQLKNNILSCKTIDEIKSAESFVKIDWCGNDDCGQRICEESGFTMLGTPVNSEKLDKQAKCVLCNKEAATKAYMARTY